MRDRAKAAQGTDGTWNSQPANGDWNTTANWTPVAVPTGTATFGPSTATMITFSKLGASVDDIVFQAGAPSYTILFTASSPSTPALTINQGVTNDSGTTQQFTVAAWSEGYTNPQLVFGDGASAGGPDIAYAAGPANDATAIGGGVILFQGSSTAGSATFTVTTGPGAPPEYSTVGGEVGFCGHSNAGTGTFIVHGSVSSANRGDTFGNAVFHDESTAAQATFTNAGGTISGCDGGNTQFYNTANAGNGTFHNLGGTVAGANGGDVAFDGTSTAESGTFYNYASTANGGHGGVTSFNNNKPYMAPTQGASAGQGLFLNSGAQAAGQGGGHTYFTGKYGSGSGGNGVFGNYGSQVGGQGAQGGHTVFSITYPFPTGYGPFCPDAGNGLYWNFPGTAADAQGGYTEFTVYPAKQGGSVVGSVGPTGGDALCLNMGATVAGASGGQTTFAETTNAVNATLVAVGGSNGGYGGKIVFYDGSSGGAASVVLQGNGTLDLSDHQAPGLTIGSLDLFSGVIRTLVGSSTTCLTVSGTVTIHDGPVTVSFSSKSNPTANTAYTILSSPSLPGMNASQFTGNTVNGLSPSFSINGNALQVTFS